MLEAAPGLRAVAAGEVVAPGDPAAFAQAAVRLLQQPAELAAMGTRARDHAQSAFDVGRIADRFESLWSISADRRDAA